jgi:hypothetical protein
MKVVPNTENSNATFNGERYDWRIQILYSEFNTAAWLVNLGVFTPDGPVNYLNGTSTNSTAAKRSLAGVDGWTLRGNMI